ncbi:hypothetical protein ACFB49_10130 [Sphingomonas sp. DBB INV C78]|uniref:hypothetical protein n=1 Tax=Sphingomonas sp. DBB INV C78 TaxID=3349434 RepID=UPI0036D2F687
MASYRLFLWSRTENRLRESDLAAEPGADGAELLEAFDHVGRCALHASGSELPELDNLPVLSKTARARQHLRAARRLLEDLGEYVLAARTAVPLAELNRRGSDDGDRDQPRLLPHLPA